MNFSPVSVYVIAVPSGSVAPIAELMVITVPLASLSATLPVKLVAPPSNTGGSSTAVIVTWIGTVAVPPLPSPAVTLSNAAFEASPYEGVVSRSNSVAVVISAVAVLMAKWVFREPVN